jgi:hypothetical protein
MPDINKYNLVETHIDYVRRLMREDSDDSYFTDEEIYKTLLDARSLIMERRVLKGKQIPDDMYQVICMPLCVDKYHDCDCVPDLGCEVLKTKYEVPRAFFNGATDLMRTSTLWGEEIAPSTEAKKMYREYMKTGKGRMYYVRANNKLNIFNRLPKPLKIIKIAAVFEDPVGAASVHNCDPDSACYDILGTGFSVKASDNAEMYQLVLEKLLKTKMTPEDRSNNAEGVPQEIKY